MTTKKDSTKGNPGSKPPSTFEERLAEAQKALEQSARARSWTDESRDDLIKARANTRSAIRSLEKQGEAIEARTKELHDLYIELVKQKISSSAAPARERKPEATNSPQRASRRDPVKEKIAELKLDYRGISQLEICRNLDQHNDRAKKPLYPLEDWQRFSHDRTWEGNLTNPKTKNRVKRFISGIPPA